MSTGRFFLAALMGAALAVAAMLWVFSGEREALRVQAQASADEVRRAQAEEARAVAKLREMELAHVAVIAARDELVRKREAVRTVTKTFGQKLAARTATRVVRELGSAAPRSFPVAGAVVNAGMLALTVADACLTLRELSEVHASLERSST